MGRNVLSENSCNSGSKQSQVFNVKTMTKFGFKSKDHDHDDVADLLLQHCPGGGGVQRQESVKNSKLNYWKPGLAIFRYSAN